MDRARVRVTGPLAPFADGFRAQLAAQGYRPNSATLQLRLLAHVSRWLATQGLDSAALVPETITSFLSARRAEGYTAFLSPHGLAPLLTYLRALGVAPLPEELPPSAEEAFLSRYRSYLDSERGVSHSVANDYIHLLRPFVAGRANLDGAVDFSSLTAEDVTEFVLTACPRTRAPRTAQMQTTALRSFLRYLFVEGLTPEPLAWAVPSVAQWRLAALPVALEPDDVRRLLAACDRQSPSGRRNFAILTLLARLGLRAAEVSALRLDDFDWRSGEVVIRGKGNRLDRLPLPADVGEAVASHLQDPRPPLDTRAVFLRVVAPYGELSPRAVRFVVFSTAVRAGLGGFGAHTLRRTVATQMVRGGIPLPEVAQVLRHHRLMTTAIYAKLDYARLRLIARPWPVHAL